MTKYTTHIIGKKEIAEGTMEFILEKPEGFAFKAGQNADYFLINPPMTDAEGNKRTFSFVSSPDEKNIRWATRMRDTAFKNSMKILPNGSEIELDGPYGDMTLHNNFERAAVFLAGGIGITPFFSMIKDVAEKKLPHKIFLFYSNRRPEDTALLSEIQSLEKENLNFKFIGTMTDLSKSAQNWGGEQGFINKEMLVKYLGDLSGPIYYMAGPASFVSAMRKILNDAGINDDDIRTEEFTGY